MSIENKDPTISIVDCAFKGPDVKQNKTIDITEIKPSKSNDSSINTLSSNECRSPSSLYNNNNDTLSRRPSSLNLGKSTAYSAVSDVSSSPILSELLSSINNNHHYHQHSSLLLPPSYALENIILIIIMPNSIIDRDTTLNNIEKLEYKIIDQQSIQLSSSQIDHLFSFQEPSTIQSHYKQLYDNWKEISISEKVQVVLLEKENAINDFQTILTTQNNTTKNNRIIDPLSIYASISQENTKNVIELILKPVWDRQASNNLGESVSSASFVLPSGTYENHDIVIHYASKEKLITSTVVIDGENNEEKKSNNEKVSAAIESLKLNAKKSNASLKNSIKMDNQKQVPPIPLLIEKKEESIKNEDDIKVTETTVMKQQGLNKDNETKKDQSSSSSIIINDNKGDDHLLMDENNTINNNLNNNNENKEGFNYSETSTITKTSYTIKSNNSDTTTETIKKEIIIDSTTSEEKNSESIDGKNSVDTEKEVMDTSIAINSNIPNIEEVNDLSMDENYMKESSDKEKENDEENKKIKTRIAVLDKQKSKDLDENKTSNKKINRKEISPPKYGSIKKKTLISQKHLNTNDKINKVSTTHIPSIRSKTKDENKTNETTTIANNNNNNNNNNNKHRLPRVALLANEKTKKNRTTTGLSDTITITTEESSTSSHEKKKTKSTTKPKKVTTSSAIARLTAPTESSARRKQSVVNGKVVVSSTTTMTNTITTTTEKPSSTTAFIRLEGKKRISSGSKKESSLPISKPLPPIPSSITIIKDEKNNIKKDDSKQLLKKSSIEDLSPETENGNDEEKYLEIKIPQDSLNPTNSISSTKSKEIQEAISNENDEENKNTGNEIKTKEEPVSPRSPESSSTSSRPNTPPQQEENSTSVTLDTVSITMKQGNNSNVKDMLQRFT